MNIVSFWVPRPEHQLHRDYGECLRLQREACERLGLRQIIITEPGALPGFATFETEMPRALMRAILAGQRAFLESPAFDGDTVLVGADCLPLYDPAPVFDGSFDVAGTTHPFPDCILNCGTLFCSAGSGVRLAAVWRAAEAKMGDAWGDDQRALAGELGATLRHGDYRRGDLRVRFLPLRPYNDAPEDASHMIDPLFAHFRGPRKRRMGEWWRRWLATR